MKTFCASLLALSVVATPLLAGALLLELGNPSANPEALAKDAVVVARITACHSPEKTIVSATAEGVVNGMHKSIPLKVIPLSTAGTFAVTREWPEQGTWAIKLTATNPDYRDYATSSVVPIANGSAQLNSTKHYFHAATDAEVATSLN